MKRVRDYPIAVRLGVTGAVVGVLFVVAAGVGLAAVADLRAAGDRVTAAEEQIEKATDLRSLASQVGTLQIAYVWAAMRDPADRAEDAGPRRAFLTAAAALDAAIGETTNRAVNAWEPAISTSLRREFSDFMKEDERIWALVQAGDPESFAQAAESIDSIEARHHQGMVDASYSLATSRSDELQASLEALSATSSRSRWAIIAATVAALLIGAVALVRITLSIVRPLRKGIDVLDSAADGDLTARLDVARGDELGQMAGAINRSMDNIAGAVRAIRESAHSVAASSEDLAVTSGQMSAASDEAAIEAASASSAAEQVSANVQAAASSTEEISSSIREIASSATEAASVAAGAVRTADTTNVRVGRLGESSAEIGEVLSVITAIAEQINLLALNATIEAARAGDAGKGFAVVANEVKELAKETARSVEEIGTRILAIQGDASEAIRSIGEITEIISRIDEIQATIATAVEEQSSTSNEIARSVGDAAAGTTEIASSAGSVARAAQGASVGAASTRSASQELARLAEELLLAVAHFNVGEERAEGASARTRPGGTTSVRGTASGSGDAPNGSSGLPGSFDAMDVQRPSLN